MLPWFRRAEIFALPIWVSNRSAAKIAPLSRFVTESNNQARRLACFLTYSGLIMSRESRRRSFPVHILIFLAPAVLIYTVFMIYPIFDSLWLSLTNRTAEWDQIFVGLQNYQTLLSRQEWLNPLWNALRNNILFFVIHMLVQNPIGLLLAALLATRIRGTSIYRTIIFTPTILSVVIIGFIWKLILNPAWGISRNILGVFGLASLAKPWLGLESTALTTLSLISVWQNIGIPMILFLAALIRIPEDLVEAAKVDGAGPWKIFWSIQFPLILPTVGLVAVLTFVGNFNAFELIYATQGAIAGPNFASDILGTLFFRTFFGYQLQPADPFMGSAVAGVMLIIILIGVLIYLLGWQRRLQEIQY
jgi:raffinose/stachyose/melibiose transport system permease protein